MFSVTLSSAQSSVKTEKYVLPLSTSPAKEEKNPAVWVDLVADRSKENCFSLTINNPERNKLRLSLQNANQGEVYRKELSDSLYRNRFNFTEAEDGEYVLTINYGKEKLTKRLFINTETEVSRKTLTVVE